MASGAHEPTSSTDDSAYPQPFEPLLPQRFLSEVKDPLVGALTLRTGDRDLAEDLAQETIARALANWERVSEMANPTGWMYRVGFNLAASHWRRLAIGVRAERGAAESTSFQLHTAEDMVVRNSLARLSRRQQEVIILRFYLGFSVTQVAETLGVAQGTVKTQTHRALKHLRIELEDSHGVD